MVARGPLQLSLEYRSAWDKYNEGVQWEGSRDSSFDRPPVFEIHVCNTCALTLCCGAA